MIPFCPLASPDSPQPIRDRYLCVEAREPELAALGLSTDESYASFVTLWASAEEEHLLRRAGLRFFEIGGRDEVVLPAASFTPSAAEFASKGLGSLTPSGEGQHYLVVKLKGPEKVDWLEAIRATGAATVGGPLSHYNILVRAGDREARAISGLPFVRWLGELGPEHKLPYPLAGGDIKFDLVFFKEAPEDFQLALRMVEGAGGQVVELDCGTGWWNSAVVRAPRAVAERILQLPGLWVLETAGQAGPRNDLARWVLQSFDSESSATPYWEVGLIGNGEVAGIADSGIDYDHIGFRDKMNDQGEPGPTHRKIVRYNTSIDDWDQNANGHGTHTAGSLAGDSLATLMGYDQYDGMVYGARLAVYDIVDAEGNWDPPLVRGIFQDAYDYGAHTHSDSWGDDRYEYTLRAQRADQFQWDHSDFLSVWAVGNKGPARGTVEEPATGKNLIGVGAAINGNTTDLASFSAHGPTMEGLIAPTLVAPGYLVHSARSDGQRNTFNDAYKDMWGTSMATPLVSACSVIIEQYFIEGFYPEGGRHSGPGFQPSGPLRKAVLVASGWDQAGGKNVEGSLPDFSQGWGKIDLANALYLNTYDKSRRLWVSDYYNDSHINDGLPAGETRTHQISVNSSQPLKVVLTWNDWPGAGLVNDLNLEVTCPDGTVYRGNQLVNGSSVDSDTADYTNTVEAVILDRPAPGPYMINVTALRVGNGSRQRYALVATGDLFDSSVGLVRLDRERTGPNSVLQVSLLDSDLRGAGSVAVEATSTSEVSAEAVTLREAGAAGLFEGTLTLRTGTPAKDGVLEVKDGDEVRVVYRDAAPPGTSWDSARVDGAPPLIRSIELGNVTNSSAFISLETDEVSTVRAVYRNRFSEWELTDAETAFRHELELCSLYPRNDYSVELLLEDPFGNSVRADFGGKHLNFRTHDLTYRPLPGFAGWAAGQETLNRFGEEGLSAGYVNGAARMAAIRFDSADFPVNVMISGAQLRLMARNSDGALSESLWTVELLSREAAGIFDGQGQPNYTAIQQAGREDYLGDQFNSSKAPPGRWQLFNLTAVQDRILSRNLAEGHASFRIKGPLTGPESVLEWYSGRSGSTAFFAPQLVIDLDYPPEVVPWAVTRIEMDEDTVDSTSVNASRIFEDEEALVFDSPTNFDGSGANLTVAVASDGRVTFRPRENWNGVEVVALRATDILGLNAVHEVTVVVRPVNDPPRIISVNGQAARDGMVFTARQDETVSLPVEVEDPDPDMEGETIWYLTNDTLVRFTSTKSPVLSFVPGNGDIGTRRVRISVRDPDYVANLNVVIVIENVNDPPTAFLELPVAGKRYDNETPIRFSGYGSSDLDLQWGDELNFTWESNGTGVIGFGEELEALLPPGKHVISLTVRDRDGAHDIASVEINVSAVLPPPPPPANRTSSPPPGSVRDLAIRILGIVMIILAVITALVLVRRGRRSRQRAKAPDEERTMPAAAPAAGKKGKKAGGSPGEKEEDNGAFGAGRNPGDAVIGAGPKGTPGAGKMRDGEAAGGTGDGEPAIEVEVIEDED